MSGLDRRDFLRAGIGGLAGLAMPMGTDESTAAAQAGGGSRQLQAAFLVQPGVVSLFDPQSNKIIQNAPWAVPEAYWDLTRELQEPVLPNLENLERWVEAPEAERHELSLNGSTLSLDDAIRMPFLGGVGATTFAGEALGELLDTGSLDLALTFTSPSAHIHRRAVAFEAGLPVIITEPDTSVAQPGQVPVRRATGEVRIPITAFGWKLQLRGPETHSLGSCVREKVKHFNLEIFRQDRRGDWPHVKNFHLGTYRSGTRRCFVLWNSEGKAQVCWKTCGPTSRDLKSMLVWVLLACAVIVGATISATTAGAIAGTAAAVFFPLMIAL